jgi:hypothetical protein
MVVILMAQSYCSAGLRVIQLTNFGDGSEQYPYTDDEGRFDSRKVGRCDRIPFNVMPTTMFAVLMTGFFAMGSG